MMDEEVLLTSGYVPPFHATSVKTRSMLCVAFNCVSLTVTAFLLVAVSPSQRRAPSSLLARKEGELEQVSWLAGWLLQSLVIVSPLATS